MQFNFFSLSPSVNGVLGQTYQPDFVTPVKLGVPMPIMGGSQKFITSSLFSPDCKATQFSSSADSKETVLSTFPIHCSSDNVEGKGLACRR